MVLHGDDVAGQIKYAIIQFSIYLAKNKIGVWVNSTLEST
jgi:hypothetical protein